MFEEYKNEVIEAHNRKSAAGVLSSHLVQASPAELRKECLKVYRERYSQKDERILRAFFGPETEENNFAKLIGKTELDKFKPLGNMMRGKIQEPRLSSIDLLAWLIDFNPRPHALWINNAVVLNEEPVVLKEEPVVLKEEAIVPEKETVVINPALPGEIPVSKVGRWAKFKNKETLISYMILLVLGIGVFMAWRDSPLIGDSKQCMYWNVDHYEPVSCSEKKDDADVIALDEDRIAHFKKITQPDTLTVNSLGKVWYITNRGETEFFTAPGEYPVDRNKRVLPMSKGILQKYVLYKDL
ncbi:hypothetical protein OQX61_12565 [Pedobacter sp. PLR]|uniref:hypothetical protein n=1 Tax=Pedobacter sp. PLR TaxID=2994465 RepID=UPI0022480F9E|nr:hypothetical protein [Pedobacter sp. PLR]MCX2452097.1 hypothetical protein [Pedobacter sp. PLR]